MDESLAARIERAKQLWATARNAAMATVNADGSPHNTPFYLIHDAQLEYMYWGSSPASLHSINALRTGQIFVVVYESNAGGGLYISADTVQELAGTELEGALKIHNELRARENKKPLDVAYYLDDSPQRMYRAQPTHFYVNSAERDSDGHVIRDIRVEVSLEDLRA